MTKCEKVTKEKVEKNDKVRKSRKTHVGTNRAKTYRFPETLQENFEKKKKLVEKK
mgnify:CR=1 FL=1